MDLPRLSTRRIAGGIAIAAAAALVPTVAMAAPGAAVKPAATARLTARATPPECHTPKLVVWLDTQGDGAAGSIVYQLEFTNLSGHTCTLFGFPGVSAVDLAGNQLGSAAGRDHAVTSHTVTLKAGATATAAVQVINAFNFPPAKCKLVTAAGFRVFPPNTTVAKVVPFPFPACSRNGLTYLFVQPVRG